jgi:hypothetical protein
VLSTNASDREAEVVVVASGALDRQTLVSEATSDVPARVQPDAETAGIDERARRRASPRVTMSSTVLVDRRSATHEVMRERALRRRASFTANTDHRSVDARR